MRLIDSDWLPNKLCGDDPANMEDYYYNAIKEAPTIEAEPVRHGEWEFGEIDIMGVPVKCSACGFSLNRVDPVMWLDYPAHKYCGCCGAKMDGKEHYEK